MKKHTCPKIFITGIPTAGKSYLARRIVKETGGYCLETDNLREELAKDPRYREWATFFKTADKEAFYKNNGPEQQWEILSEMHEKLWPGVLERIRDYERGRLPLRSRVAAFCRKPRNKKRPLVFEGINIPPRLARQDLDFPGIVLVGGSFDEVLERNRRRPRWGKSEEMLKMGAEAFWFVQRPHYIEEAKQCGYKIFENADEAYAEVIKMLGLK